MSARLQTYEGVFVEHADPWKEHNKAVIAALLNRPLEFWFVEVDLEDIHETERRLVHEMNPSANRIRYKAWREK
jgi:hypothetical protein